MGGGCAGVAAGAGCPFGMVGRRGGMRGGGRVSPVGTQTSTSSGRIGIQGVRGGARRSRSAAGSCPCGGGLRTGGPWHVWFSRWSRRLASIIAGAERTRSGLCHRRRRAVCWEVTASVLLDDDRRAGAVRAGRLFRRPRVVQPRLATPSSRPQATVPPRPAEVIAGLVLIGLDLVVLRSLEAGFNAHGSSRLIPAREGASRTGRAPADPSSGLRRFTVQYPASTRGISHLAVRSRARRARNPIHRGILRRVSAQEDRRGDRSPAERPRPPDSPRHGAAARRSRHRRAGLLQGRPRSAPSGNRAEADRSRPPAARRRAVRWTPRAVHLDRRHAARLARPGILPRPHRAAGSLGHHAGLRRDRRQDQEQVLRDARHARPPAIRGGEIRAERATTTPSRRCISARSSTPKCSTATAAPRRSSRSPSDRRASGRPMPPKTPYSQDLGDRDPIAAMRDTIGG